MFICFCSLHASCADAAESAFYMNTSENILDERIGKWRDCKILKKVNISYGALPINLEVGFLVCSNNSKGMYWPRTQQFLVDCPNQTTLTLQKFVISVIVSYVYGFRQHHREGFDKPTCNIQSSCLCF